MTLDWSNRRIKTSQGRKVFKHCLFMDAEAIEDYQKGSSKQRADLIVTNYVHYGNLDRVKYDEWRHWINRSDFYNYFLSLFNRTNDLYVMSHNMDYDLMCTGLYYLLNMEGWKADFLYTKDQTFICTARKDKRLVRLLSTTNWFTESIAVYGEMIGLPKDDIDLSICTVDEAIPYCYRDTEICRRIYEDKKQFIRANDLPGVSLTRASQAFNTLMNKFCPVSIYTHDCKKVKDLERKSYFGGMVQQSRYGEIKNTPMAKIDVNSMYPAVMKNEYYPIRLVNYLENPSLNTLKCLLQYRCCIARVSVHTDQPVYPVKVNSENYWVTGQFETVLCSGMLKYALERGHIKQVLELAIYEQAKIFPSFVDFFYNIKQKASREGDNVGKKNAKLYLNSCYGKFGQLICTDPLEPIDPDEDVQECEWFNLDSGRRCKVKKFLNTKRVEQNFEDAKITSTAIASHVTDYARKVLAEVMEIIDFANCYYIDTDCIILPKEVLPLINHLIDKHELGKWDLEEESDSAYFQSAKTYNFGSTKKAKGIPKGAKEISPGLYEFDSLITGQSAVSEGINDAVGVKKRIRSYCKVYNRGKRLPNGKVEPFSLPSDAPLLPGLPET